MHPRPAPTEEWHPIIGMRDSKKAEGSPPQDMQKTTQKTSSLEVSDSKTCHFNVKMPPSAHAWREAVVGHTVQATFAQNFHDLHLPSPVCFTHGFHCFISEPLAQDLIKTEAA